MFILYQFCDMIKSNVAAFAVNRVFIP